VPFGTAAPNNTASSASADDTVFVITASGDAGQHLATINIIQIVVVLAVVILIALVVKNQKDKEKGQPSHTNLHPTISSGVAASTDQNGGGVGARGDHSRRSVLGGRGNNNSIKHPSFSPSGAVDDGGNTKHSSSDGDSTSFAAFIQPRNMHYYPTAFGGGGDPSSSIPTSNLAVGGQQLQQTSFATLPSGFSFLGTKDAPIIKTLTSALVDIKYPQLSAFLQQYDAVYGAHFPTEFYTRGCHWFARLLG
jgi:hypothetical protein